MSPEAQRIAIAEVCGWKRHADGVGFYQGEFHAFKTSYGCPDYLNDLNALHEAEKFLNNKASIQSYLENIIVNVLEEHAQGDGSLEETWLVCQASAKLRAKSFLQTFGKWVPGE